MKYVSTRGGVKPTSFCDILLEGLAPDGGLFLPEEYPRIDRATLDQWRTLSYAQLAFAVVSLFIDDIPLNDLSKIVYKTYTPQTFRFARRSETAKDITPVIKLEEGLYLQELSNGPTLAFKDMAMQLLGNLFEYVLNKRKDSLNILGATSGDTGSAAEYAMLGKRNVNVFMLSPQKGMSPFQAAQMYSLRDPNIFNIAVSGNFDSAQDVVKAVSDDAGFKKLYKIGAVNSINWARVMAQVIYYFFGYFRATKSNDERVSFAVPSGNLGNICAGHIARMMGLPIKNLILATNENDVLDEFFRTGVYRPRADQEVHKTSSPSMDISKASNFERFIFDLVGRDAELVKVLWTKIKKGDSFNLSQHSCWGTISQFGIISGSSNHADRLETIRLVFEMYGQVIDPHTADAMKVALEYWRPSMTTVVLETAQPAKFEEVIEDALGVVPSRPKELEGIEKLPKWAIMAKPTSHVIKRIIRNRLG